MCEAPPAPMTAAIRSMTSGLIASDASAFSRAFKRWTGERPGAQSRR